MMAEMSPATYRFLADAVVIFHFAFVAFVLLGGLLVLRWRKVSVLHLPCVAWGVYIELSHGICPLTPLENRLRLQGGRTTYGGGFVDEYIMRILYPKGLTDEMQVWLAVLIFVMTVSCYTGAILLWRRARRRRLATMQAETSPAQAIETIGSGVEAPSEPDNASIRAEAAQVGSSR